MFKQKQWAADTHCYYWPTASLRRAPDHRIASADGMVLQGGPMELQKDEQEAITASDKRTLLSIKQTHFET